MEEGDGMIQPVGFFKIHRELFVKPIWLQSTLEQQIILITLIAMANYSEKQWEWKGKKFKAKPGQFVTSLNSIVKDSGPGVTMQNVRTALKRFENLEFLTNESTKQGRLITIVNWELYQGQGEQPNKGVNSHLTKSQQRPNKQLTSKEECKEGKKERKEIYRCIQHLELSKKDFDKLLDKYSREDIDDVLDHMENYSGLKKYKSAYLTANNWLKRRIGEKGKQPAVESRDWKQYVKDRGGVTND